MLIDISYEYIAAILIILCLFIVLVANELYIHTPRWRNIVRPVEKFRKEIPDGLDILNTGSNHAFFSIDWTLTHYKGFSLASGSQSISWDYRLWSLYKRKIKPNGIALFVLSDLIFGFTEYPNDKSNFRYYQFLGQNVIPHWTRWKDIRYHRLPVLQSWKCFLYPFLRRGHDFVEKPPTLEYAEQESDARIAGWEKEFSLKDLQHRESAAHLGDDIEEAIGILCRMTSEARDIGAKPILMIPPLSKVIKKKIAPEFLDEVLYKPVRKYLPDVPLLDYLSDNRFDDWRLYQNSDFMNKAGRAAFMPVLEHDLDSIECEGEMSKV